jgi:hypothetical protein
MKILMILLANALLACPVVAIQLQEFSPTGTRITPDLIKMHFQEFRKQASAMEFKEGTWELTAPTLPVGATTGVDLSLSLVKAPRCNGAVAVYEFSGEMGGTNIFNDETGTWTIFNFGNQFFTSSFERRSDRYFQATIVDSNNKKYPAELRYMAPDSKISSQEMSVVVNGTPVNHGGNWLLRDASYVSRGGHKFNVANNSFTRICYSLENGKQNLIGSSDFTDPSQKAMITLPYISFDLDPKTQYVFYGVGPLIVDNTSGVISVRVASQEDEGSAMSIDFIPAPKH